MKTLVTSSLALLLTFATATLSCTTSSSTSNAIVDNVSRSADDRKLDELRKPKDLLIFSKVKPGDTVVEMIAGRGYFTRLFSSSVGPGGHVISVIPKEIENAPFKPVEAGKAAVKGLSNTELKVIPILDSAADGVDLYWIFQNYHDFHIKSFISTDMKAYNRMLFNTIKPGGHLVIVDHVAVRGAGNVEMEKLHRIDPLVVRKELEEAGFVLEEESKVLRRAEDHSLNVFDPAIRGKTDQFAYRFVRPLQ